MPFWWGPWFTSEAQRRRLVCKRIRLWFNAGYICINMSLSSKVLEQPFVDWAKQLSMHCQLNVRVRAGSAFNMQAAGTNNYFLCSTCVNTKHNTTSNSICRHVGERWKPWVTHKTWQDSCGCSPTDLVIWFWSFHAELPYKSNMSFSEIVAVKTIHNMWHVMPCHSQVLQCKGILPHWVVWFHSQNLTFSYVSATA